MWRVGNKVPLNVYDGDRPVCQCHREIDALMIVVAMNRQEDRDPLQVMREIGAILREPEAAAEAKEKA